MMKEDLLGQLESIAEKPSLYLRELKEKYSQKIALNFCSYTPVEIFHSFGIHTARFISTPKEIHKADIHLQSYSCNYARNALEAFLSDEYDFVDAVIFPQCCDTLQSLSDIFEVNELGNKVYHIPLPLTFDSEAARKYTQAVLSELFQNLEHQQGIDYAPKNLLNSISLYARLNASVSALYDLQGQKPGILSSRQLHQVARAAMTMPVEKAIKLLEQLAQELEEAPFEGSDSRSRLFISGSNLDSAKIMGLIDQLGGVVVDDDLCFGRRTFEPKSNAGGEPLQVLIENYASRINCPCRHTEQDRRINAVIKRGRRCNVNGFIFLLQKFCEPHYFDYPRFKNKLKEAGIPTTLIELESSARGLEQIRTRLQAFMEMIR